MPKDIIEDLDRKVLICDGAMGTMLQEKGLPAGVPPEEWDLSHPERVEEIHRAYIEAGSDIIQTNTFGGNRIKLASYGLEDRVYEINRKGAEIARRAAGDRVYVAASVGPTGQFLQPVGSLTFEDMVEAFSDQVRGVAEGGADAIIIETMYDLGEAKAALQAVRQICSLPVICTMTFETSLRTLMGVRPEEAVRELWSAGVEVVGANCSLGSEQMLKVVQLMREASAKARLIVQPNAGLPVYEGGKTVYKETPETMAAFAVKYKELGARIIGACCGSTPDHIRAIRASLRSH